MIERVQPVVKGIDEKGELVWAVIPMPRWQMEMFSHAVDWLGEFIGHWLDLHCYQSEGEDFQTDESRDYYLVASKREIQKLKHFYPRKKRGH